MDKKTLLIVGGAIAAFLLLRSRPAAAAPSVGVAEATGATYPPASPAVAGPAPVASNTDRNTSLARFPTPTASSPPIGTRPATPAPVLTGIATGAMGAISVLGTIGKTAVDSVKPLVGKTSFESPPIMAGGRVPLF